MIATELLVEAGKKLYFKSRYIPGTFCYDLTNNNTRFIVENENEKPDFMPLDYYWAVKYKDYIVFPPFLGAKFTIYNINENKFIYLDKRKNCIYRSHIVINKKYYLFTLNSNETTILEENNGKFSLSYPSDLTSDTRVKINNYGECCCNGDDILLASANPNELITYSIKQNRFDTVNIDMDGMIAYTIHSNGEYIWVTGDRPVIYIIDKKLQTVLKRINMPLEYHLEKINTPKMCFSMGAIVDNFIFYAPMSYKAVVRVDTQTNEIEMIMPFADDMYSLGISYVTENCLHINMIKDEKKHWSYFIDYAGNIREKNVFKISNWKTYYSSLQLLYESDFSPLGWMLGLE